MTTHHRFSIRQPKAQRLAACLTLTTVAVSGIARRRLRDVLQWCWMLAERRLKVARPAASVVVATRALILADDAEMPGCRIYASNDDPGRGWQVGWQPRGMRS